MLNYFELNAKETTTGKAVTTFQKDLEISVNHESEELGAIDINSLQLFYLNEKTKQWVPAGVLKYDAKTKKGVTKINHFSHYGEMANPLTAGPGRIMATQVDLQAGSLTFNYPIELPPGPGGFQPKLNLNYNSASVMK